MTTRQDLSDADIYRITQKLRTAGLLSSCLHCHHFNATPNPEVDGTRPAGYCLLYNIRPPDHVIAFGCESWEEQIPF